MKKKKAWKLGLMGMVIAIATMLTGCQWLDNELGKMEEALKGRTFGVSTYDEDAQQIDRISGKSISISPDDQFKLTDSDGNTTEKSSVISLTVGGQSMVHVGSSLIAEEKGLKNVLNEYEKTVNIKNEDKSTPIINRIVNDAKNLTTGKKRVVLIRSQTGKPLATYAGNKVSYFATGIDKSTGILIDGKYLFIYRCDYTIYDKELLQK